MADPLLNRRDSIALEALKGLLANPRSVTSDTQGVNWIDVDGCINRAFEAADKFLEQRGGQPTGHVGSV